MDKESHTSMKELQHLPKIPSELMERLTNETDLNWLFKSDMRMAHVSDFLLALQMRFVSKPMVSSKTYRQFFLVLRREPGRS